MKQTMKTVNGVTFIFVIVAANNYCLSNILFSSNYAAIFYV